MVRKASLDYDSTTSLDGAMQFLAFLMGTFLQDDVPFT